MFNQVASLQAENECEGRLRVGVVNYLNSRPLVEFLPEVLPEASLVWDTPARLSDDLARGKLDIGLVPVAEWFRHPNWQPISDACIACRGPVRTVVLLGRKDLTKIRLLAADVGSRTSVALVRLILREQVGIDPQIVPLPGEVAPEAAVADAVLLIGDRAIRSAQDGWPFVWDLGQVWTSWTGLPFVFALWLARPELARSDLSQLFALARDKGLQHVDEISRRYGPEVGWSLAECRRYFRENLWFYLDEETSRGLELFRTMLTSHGIVNDKASWPYTAGQLPDWAADTTGCCDRQAAESRGVD